QIEMSMLDLVIAHDDRWIALGECRGEAPGSGPGFCRNDPQLEPVERVIGRIGNDPRFKSGNIPEAFDPELEMAGFPCTDLGVIAFLPSLQGCNRTGDTFLADFHAAADPVVLEKRRSHQRLAAGNGAG